MAIQLNKAKTFLDRVLQHVPDDKKEEVRALYSSAHDEVSAVERTLAEGIATVNTRAAAQADWWNKHDPTNPDRQNPNNDPDPRNPNPNPNPNSHHNPITAAVDRAAIDRDVDTKLEQTRNQLAEQGLFLASVIPTIIAQHGVEFGEVLDGEKLITDALAAKQDIKTYYSNSVATRRAEKSAAKHAADIAAAEARGRQAGLTEAGNRRIPYPTGGNSAATLDSLRPARDGETRPDTSLEAAVATAMDVQARQVARDSA